MEAGPDGGGVRPLPRQISTPENQTVADLRVKKQRLVRVLYRIMVTEGRGVESIFEPVEDDNEGE